MANQKPPDDQNKNVAENTSTTDSDQPVFVTLTHQQLIELMRESRIDPRREEELKAEGIRVANRRAQMVKIARADENAKASRQKMCQHRKPNGEETSGGQEFSDGRVRIFCLRCQKVLREYWSPSVAQGMALAAKMGKLGITEDELLEAMEFKGEGHSSSDTADDFALGHPRRNQQMVNSLTTDNH